MADLFPTRVGTLTVILVVAWCLAIATAQESLAPPTSITFTATLSAGQLVAPVDSPGSGEVRALLIGDQLVVTGTYRELSSPLHLSSFSTGANIRRAPAGEDGSIVRLSAEQAVFGAPATMTLTTDGGTSGWFTGVFTLTDEQVEALKGGLYYVQLYTEENATGELRGQLGTDRVFDATAEDLVGIWRDVRDGRIFENFPDGSWSRGTDTRPDYEWAFADDRFSISWGGGYPVAHEELYRDGRRRHLVLESDGAGSSAVGTVLEFVKVDEEGNRIPLRE